MQAAGQTRMLQTAGRRQQAAAIMQEPVHQITARRKENVELSHSCAEAEAACIG